MLVIKLKVGYLTKLYWQSYASDRLQRLGVESCLLGMPFFLPIGLTKHRLYVLRSSHAHNKSAECLEACIWLGSRQFFCLFSIIRFLDSHLLYNEGTLFHKLVCCLEISRFSCLKLFFFETTQFLVIFNLFLFSHVRFQFV